MGKLRLFLSVIVIMAIMGFMAYATGPAILRDWQLRGVQTAEVPSRLDGGSCKVYLFAVNFCDLKLTTEHGTLDETLLFFDIGHTQGYDVVARAAQNDLTQITTNIGLDMFWNRVVTLAVFLGLFLFGIVGSVGRLFAKAPQHAT